MNVEELRESSGRAVRLAARSGLLVSPTTGLALGYVQANLVVLPKQFAFDFLLFCHRNPKPCPLLEVTDAGSPTPRWLAPDADLRTDLPAYRVFVNGVLEDEPTDLKEWWRDDLVAFLIGCSFTFENALLRAGIGLRHLDLGCNVSMYRTNLACESAGIFHGPMVVSMRPMRMPQALEATRICARYPRVHGTPVHVGNPLAIGITHLDRPDFGDPVPVHHDELPVFWACGVTPQAVIMDVRPPLVITHKPGYMFVSDWLDDRVQN